MDYKKIIGNSSLAEQQRLAGLELDEYRKDPGSKRMNVKIMGWGGTRKIPKKELQAFRQSISSIPGAGFDFFTQNAQVNKKDLQKLEPILKKHGLRGGSPTPAKSYIGPRG